MNNDDDNNDINRRIQILTATIQMAEICLFDDDEEEQNDAELQLLNLFSSESFTNELVTIIGERALDALSEFDNPRKRGAEDTADGDELAAATPNDDEAPTRRRKSRWNWERARSAVFFDDYTCDTPIFDDHQFERMFRITKTVMQELRTQLGNEDDYFTKKLC
jgi:hypothetical protein